MSELSEAISEMRNMRESYDQIGAAAEAYNTGKAELAQNITAKGVQASASETLPELAEKVNAISQDTYEINGGEMYAKQLFGVANNDIVPGFWNLYDILAQLLSDGRLVTYGGILLAEYYKGYDSLALAGAGAGGAYVVSDKDANGNFIMYTEDTTHTWATEDDGKGNRWVAYCFADEYHDFQITDTNTSPRSIFIGRKVGTITLLANARTSQVVVPDGNELVRYDSSGRSSNWNSQTIIRMSGSAAGLVTQINKIASLYVECGGLSDNHIFTSQRTKDSTLCCIILKCESIYGTNGTTTALFNNPSEGTYYTALSHIIISGVKSCTNFLSLNNWAGSTVQRLVCTALKRISIIKTEELNLATNFTGCENLTSIYIGYDTNDRTKRITLSQGTPANLTDIILQDGWCKPLNVAVITNLTKENIVSHILNRLGDNTGQSAITITLGATNLAKLTEEEKTIATNKGFTLAQHMKTQKVQEGNWLYQDQSEDYRYFTKEVYLPDDAELWAECTNEEKEAWEEEHKPQPEPQENK